ncbi:MAG: hypothetical protein KJ587_20305, partial [Alphaproteobacteria bacterium]|nr:hypothetical protein [Alphaproteobacteria bacterium]
MAYIQERIIKRRKYYYLVEGNGNGKVKTYLGTKPPKKPWKGLPPDRVEREMQKRRRHIAKPSPNPKLPEGKFAVIYADPPWRYDFAQVTDWSVEEHYDTLTTEDIKTYKDQNGRPIQE